MDDKKLNEKLVAVFLNINDWLKFAEQKNAALLVLDGGIVWGMTKIISNINKLSDLPYWLAVIGYSLNIISALICIVSFLPVLTEKWFKPENKSNADNCLYFAHIAKYNNFEYINLLLNKLAEEEYKPNKFELDLSSQIVTNAEIALDKYKRFKLASIITIFSVISFSISVALCYF